MKKTTAVVLAALFFCLIPAAARAQAIAPTFESGAGRGNSYQEVIYITGKPVVLTGTLDIRAGRPGETVTTVIPLSWRTGRKDQAQPTLALTTTWRQEGRQFCGKPRFPLSRNSYGRKIVTRWMIPVINSIFPVLPTTAPG